MHDHKHKEHDHNHSSCCDHDHSHHHVHTHDATHNDNHQHSHHHNHDHSHHHTHGHDEHHGHDCCDHDHSHGHKHLSAHDCTTLFNAAHSSSNTAEAVRLLLEAGCGFAHLGDAAATAAVNGALLQKLDSGASLTSLQKAECNALKALELAFNNKGAKEALAQSVAELENFSGTEREQVEQLLGDVRKALAKIRTSGLKSLLSKLKF